MFMSAKARRPDFPVKCPNAHEMYDGKSVAFWFDGTSDQDLQFGQFIVHLNQDWVWIDIACQALKLDLHISQAHVDSIEPADPESGVDFVVRFPFLRHHRISKTSGHQA